ncbi:MAG: hypothetical protein ACR2OV_12165, partial [Hyphomicrobiaceae bacterium]
MKAIHLICLPALFFITIQSSAAQTSTDQEPIVVAQASNARATGNRATPSQGSVVRQRLNEEAMRERINSWVVGVASGKLEGTPVRLVEEMSRVLDDGPEMQILPIITRGPSYNVHALLYLRGIDLAVINGDVLDHFSKVQNIPRLHQRVNYITQLFNSELHVLARPEIKSVEELAGKPVNFNTKGTSAAFTGPIMFDRLGIKVKKTFIPHPVAMQQMKKSDKFAAVVFVTGKPVRPLVKKKWPAGFKLLSVQYTAALEDLYLPSTLTPKDYPELIEAGTTVETVAVPTVLAAFNWSANHPRQKRVAKFVRYLFDRFDKLQKPPFHPKWRNINLAAQIPGWQRLPAAQQMLKQVVSEKKVRTFAPSVRALAQNAAPGDPAAQERLFEAFLNWYRT